MKNFIMALILLSIISLGGCTALKENQIAIFHDEFNSTKFLENSVSFRNDGILHKDSINLKFTSRIKLNKISDTVDIKVSYRDTNLVFGNKFSIKNPNTGEIIEFKIEYDYHDFEFGYPVSIMRGKTNLSTLKKLTEWDNIELETRLSTEKGYIPFKGQIWFRNEKEKEVIKNGNIGDAEVLYYN